MLCTGQYCPVFLTGMGRMNIHGYLSVLPPAAAPPAAAAAATIPAAPAAPAAAAAAPAAAAAAAAAPAAAAAAAPVVVKTAHMEILLCGFLVVFYSGRPKEVRGF